MSNELSSKPVVELWLLLWEMRTLHQNCKQCTKRTRRKVKGPEGSKSFPLYVCDRKFDNILEELTKRYQAKSYKILRRLLVRLGVSGYDADVLCGQRFFFALLRYHPSFYPENPEGGFFPFLTNPPMLFFDTRDYKKKNISAITFAPTNDLLADLESFTPDFDID